MRFGKMGVPVVCPSVSVPTAHPALYCPSYLMTINDFQNAPLEEVLREANRVRESHFGRQIELCSIVNIKNGHCAMDCRFCAQSRHHKTDIAAFPLLQKQALSEQILDVAQSGVARVGLVASGCRLSEAEVENLSKDVESSRVFEKQSCQFCASLGQLSEQSLQNLRAAGFSRYHHNLETSERFYPQICSTQRWRDRVETIVRAKSAGLEVCSGGLFGLGETWQDRLSLADTLRDLAVDSMPINFFQAIPGTPLANQPPLAAEEALRIIALFRIALPRVSVRLCGGRPNILPDRQHDIFRAGADALMTGNYLTTSGFSLEADCERISQSDLAVRSFP